MEDNMLERLFGPLLAKFNKMGDFMQPGGDVLSCYFRNLFP
jgi:hypothetical protein